MHRFGLSTLLVAALLSASSAHAAEKVIAKEKDWTLAEITAQDTTCIAYSKESVGKNALRFEISAKKSPRSAVEFMIRVVGPDHGHSGFALSPKDGSRRFVFASLSKDATTQFHWLVAQDTQDLLAVMNSVKELDFISIGGVKELKQDFPVNGFAKIMAHFNAKCLSNSVFANVDFEHAFLSGAQSPVDPTRLDQAQVQAVRTIYFQAYKLFLQKQDNRAELMKLRQQYANELGEMESLTALITKLESRDIPNLVSEINSVEALRVRSEGELATVRSQIPGMEQALTRTQGVLERAQQTIAPYVNEFNQRDSALDSAINSQSRAERRLASVRSEIRDLNEEIVTLRAEASRLDYEMARLEGELTSARRIHNEAERQLRSFDRDRIYRERLARDFSYERDVREARDKRSDLRAVEVELGRAQADVTARQGELTACQASDVVQDCTPKQNALNAANAVLANVRSRMQTIRSELNRIEDRIQSTENRIRREVDNEHDVLARRERDARSHVNSLESSISSKQRREIQILSAEIPRRQSDINSLSNEQSNLEREIPQWRAEVARLDGELRAFKSRVGWDQKKAALDAAQSDFSLKTQTLQTARANETSLVRTIAQCQIDKPRLENQLADARTLLANSKARQAVVRKALEPFEVERVRLDTADSALLAQIQGLGRDYESRLPR